MKNFKIIVLSLSLFSFQASSGNYFFKQVVLSAVIGAVPAVLFKNDNGSGTKAAAIITSYVFLKFFHDVLSSNSFGEGTKSFFSVPLNVSIAGATYFVCNDILK